MTERLLAERLLEFNVSYLFSKLQQVSGSVVYGRLPQTTDRKDLLIFVQL